MQNTMQKEHINPKYIKHEKRKIHLTYIIIIAVLAILLLWNIGTDFYDSIKEIEHDLDNNITQSDIDLKDKIASSVEGSVKGVLDSEHSFLVKLLIFMGVIYIINISFTLSSDVIETLLVMGMLVFKSGRFLYRKTTGWIKNNLNL